jgi:ribose transport system substrate-binding protein
MNEIEKSASRFSRPAFRNRTVALAVSLGLVVALSACAPTSTDSGTTEAGGVDAAGLATATANVEAGRLAPTWQGPDAPVTVSGLEGKRVVYINISSGIPVLKYWSDTVTELALQYGGVQVEVIDAKGSVDEANKGFQQAIATGADVVLLQAFYVDLFSKQIADAKAAGIKVITGNSGAMGAPLTGGQDAEVSFDYAKVGSLIGDWFISDSKGEGQALLITSDDVPASQLQAVGTTDTVAALCPACKIDIEDVQIPAWETSIPTLFQSTVNSKPDVKYLLPIYDGQALPGLGALRAAGVGETMNVGTFNASPGIVEQLNDPTSGLKLDVGGDNTWWAYAATDTIFRVLTDTTPIENYNIGLRVFDQSNKDLITGADEAAWYGFTGYKQEFLTLWGK